MPSHVGLVVCGRQRDCYRDGNAQHFVANFGEGKDITINWNEDGKMTVTSSQGLFAYPTDKMDFALKTGQ